MLIMILHDEAYYQRRRPVEDLGPVKNCLRFIWDNNRRAFLDRTAKDWAHVGLFYLCFFGVLFSIFSLQLFITLNILSGSDRPYFQRDSNSHSIAARSFFQQPLTHFNTPGLGLIPNIEISTVSPIIWLNQTYELAKPLRYVKEIQNFLSDYNQNQSNYNLKCNEKLLANNSKTKPCYFDIKSLNNCSQLPYGYSKPYQPCVYIKFNKVKEAIKEYYRFDWIPIYYNRSSQMPKLMPTELKDIVRTTEKPYVWLSCDGATNFDKEHIGIIEYLPERGFPVHYFPFTGNKLYLSPVVALIFKNLTANRLITVECFTWAQNIQQNQMYTLDFQIFID